MADREREPARYAYLSGFHPTLPRAELRSIHEAYNTVYKELLVLEQLVVYRSSLDPGTILGRAGSIHEIGIAHAVVEAEPERIREALKDLPKPPSRIRVTRVKGVARHLEKPLHEIASTVQRSPEGPRIHIIVSEGAAVVGIVEATLDKKSLSQRRPHLRPFFRSVALDPRLARVFVNLSRPPPQGTYYDPFCGTGGFAIEAAIMGLQVVCSDIDRAMAEGSKVNLEALAPPPHTVAHADATAMPVRDDSVDAIGTDPPYGRSASTKGRDTRSLLQGFLHEAARTLRAGRYVSFAAPHWLDIDSLVEDAGLQLAEKHYMRVHGSLTRIIAAAKKP